MTREDELFGRLRGGDEAALEELIRSHYPGILRYCLGHTPDRLTAEDAAQETFLKAVRLIDAYAHRGPAKQRKVVVLRYVHDLKLREIAEIVDEPLRTVQSRLRSALKTLERSL